MASERRCAEREHLPICRRKNEWHAEREPSPCERPSSAADERAGNDQEKGRHQRRGLARLARCDPELTEVTTWPTDNSHSGRRKPSASARHGPTCLPLSTIWPRSKIRRALRLTSGA